MNAKPSTQYLAHSKDSVLVISSGHRYKSNMAGLGVQ